MFNYNLDDDIQIRLPEKDDAVELFKLINDNRLYLSQWASWLDFIRSVEDVTNYIVNVNNQYNSNNGFHAIIIYKGNFAGMLECQSINWMRKSTVVGYWLAENFQGLGIMRKVIKFFINFAFEVLKLYKIEMTVAEENLRSRKIPESLYFKEEGKLRAAEFLNGRYLNHIIYGLLRPEWEK